MFQLINEYQEIFNKHLKDSTDITPEDRAKFAKKLNDEQIKKIEELVLNADQFEKIKELKHLFELN